MKLGERNRNMRSFEYYLYGDCPENASSDNPRALFGAKADAVLSMILEFEPGDCRYDALCKQFSEEYIQSLIRIGLIRTENGAVLLDSTVLTGKDVFKLESGMRARATRMADKIQAREAEFREAAAISNGFSAAMNLYHLLCAATFDGCFFDLLSARGVVATSRVHPSGLDYLIIVYERTPALEQFSRKLICSYNRLSDGERALQSFGDADGNRRDFYRFRMMRALNRETGAPDDVLRVWDSIAERRFVKTMLDAAQCMADFGDCDARCNRLLEYFGYVQNGRIVVPVYRKADSVRVDRLAVLADECIFDEMRAAISDKANLICSAHGVNPREIANEIYHIAFGTLNECLIARGFAASPKPRVGEGRYLRSIQVE